MHKYYLTHQKEIEADAIFIIREVAPQFERPLRFFSGGKDSINIKHLSRKAFSPAHITLD
jgi:sulfate adenylyltransferase subunit 2